MLCPLTPKDHVAAGPVVMVQRTGTLAVTEATAAVRRRISSRRKSRLFILLNSSEATDRIKEILDPLMAGPEGRTLSLLHTPFGTVLAWVKHGKPIAADAVTSANTDGEIAEALGLIIEPEQQQAQADRSSGGSCLISAAPGYLWRIWSCARPFGPRTFLSAKGK